MSIIGLSEALVRKGCNVVKEFQCPGEVSLSGFNLNLKGGLGWLAGKNRGRPDENDLKNIRTFAQGIIT